MEAPPRGKPDDAPDGTRYKTPKISLRSLYEERDGMTSGNSMIEIDKRQYSEMTLRILLGFPEGDTVRSYLKDHTVPPDILTIAWVLDQPTRFPVVLADIHGIARENNTAVRLALARAQINASLRMNENLQMFHEQKFVAETMERMIFGDLLVEGKSSRASNHVNGEDGGNRRRAGGGRKGGAGGGPVGKKRAAPRKKEPTARKSAGRAHNLDRDNVNPRGR